MSKSFWLALREQLGPFGSVCGSRALGVETHARGVRCRREGDLGLHNEGTIVITLGRQLQMKTSQTIPVDLVGKCPRIKLRAIRRDAKQVQRASPIENQVWHLASGRSFMSRVSPH
jgi:hypothetical protein